MEGILKKSETIFKEVNRHDPIIMEGLKSAPIFRKQGEVLAIIASGGEEILTKLTDGMIETKNTASKGDAIITNPGGEQYIIKREKLEQRYERKKGQKNIYIPKGHCKAIDNPFGISITILASWGEMQNGMADCKIADIYDSQTKKLDGEPYIIARKEFEQTYKQI